ncbi:MAG: DUF2203 domain-containing protein [Chloroflexi bacterium]|nr:DUF2203 domain-containing protein [Chloroflexota bacterium]
MPTKYFTVEEANDLLPTIEPLVSKLLEKRAKVTSIGQSMPHLLRDVHSGIATPETSEMVQEFANIDQLIYQIQAYGCVIKSINAGLVDFLADHNGRDVYLCWQIGETSITHFHELHNGFNGRQRIAK